MDLELADTHTLKFLLEVLVVLRPTGRPRSDGLPARGALADGARHGGAVPHGLEENPILVDGGGKGPLAVQAPGASGWTPLTLLENKHGGEVG